LGGASFAGWKACALANGLQVLEFYEGGFSPDYIGGDAVGNEFKMAAKNHPDLAQVVHDDYAICTGLTDADFIARFPSHYYLSGNRWLHNGESKSVWSLLDDAYAERIRALLRRNLMIEAQSLLDMVRQRYPASRARLAELTPRVEAKPLSLDDLVRPLNDPDLAAEQRAAIDRRLQQEVWDLAALANCDALPLDHELRKAAAALERALVAVTSGPVTDAALALPEVSRRSPLAPWKLLTRAIASFYRREDDACRRYLEAIDSESAPTRPRQQSRRCWQPHERAAHPGGRAGARIAKPSTLRSALEALDQAFASARKNRILGHPFRGGSVSADLARAARLTRQHISVRCAVAVIDPQRVVGPLGGPSRHESPRSRDSSRLRYRRPRIPTRWCWPAGYGRTSARGCAGRLVR
jgi:hypothetical protein